MDSKRLLVTETNSLSLVRLHSRFHLAAAHLVTIPAYGETDATFSVRFCTSPILAWARNQPCYDSLTVCSYTRFHLNDGQQQTQLPIPANPALQLYHVAMRPESHTKHA